MNIIVESHIPFIHGVLEPYGTVTYLPAGEITPAVMSGADALFTRTRTRCNAALLDGSPCRFIATATIGTDHIDLDYCRGRGIEVANAPGCNAPAVAQYVMASIFRHIGDADPCALTLGIVGVGHVGKIVERWARALGFRVLLCDPPRALAEGADGFTELTELLKESDIITIHTPLTSSGPYATRGLVNPATIALMERRPLLINAARGPIADNAAIADALASGALSGAVIDCWENEPAIDRRLLAMAETATPHIAGYSREGKLRATRMALDAFSRHFGLPPIAMGEPDPGPGAEAPSREEILATYDPGADTEALRSAPENFEKLRNNYDYRPEPC